MQKNAVPNPVFLEEKKNSRMRSKNVKWRYIGIKFLTAGGGGVKTQKIRPPTAEISLKAFQMI